MSDWSTERVLDAVLSQHASTAPTVRLSQQPAIAPTWWDVDVCRVVLKLARDAGLRLRADPMWRYVWLPGQVRGQTERASGRITITINIAEVRTPNELADLAFHELAHASDLSTGRWDELMGLERERRACDFSNRMLSSFSAEWTARQRARR
jgi:hypothetical protein